jgi:ribosome biogenesis GTPase
MTKRHLTRQQRKRIQEKQTQFTERVEQSNLTSSPNEIIEQEGLVVAHYGTYVDIETADKVTIRCNLRQNLGALVVGDRIIWQPIEINTGIIIAVKSRQSTLSRPTAPDKSKDIAANVDQVVIVIAAQPLPATTLLDSYISAVENNQMQAVIVFNKIDLLDFNSESSSTQLLDIYRALDYPVFAVSAAIGFGLAELQTQLQNHTSIFVGQSGVGKSSILAKMLPNESIEIGNNITQVRGLHTTTTSRLYHLAHGGDIIDSPGVREFKLWDLSPQSIAKGFIEFRPYIENCRFRDCRHDHIAHCAVQQAAAAGEIQASRIESYCRIIADLQTSTK